MVGQLWEQHGLCCRRCSKLTICALWGCIPFCSRVQKFSRTVLGFEWRCWL